MCLAATALYLLTFQNLIVMRDTKRRSTACAEEISTYVPEIKNFHKGNRESLINDLYGRSINQLINDFIVEMDAKNQAYYFILENGLFMQFRDYCLTNKNRG